jgi:hypothetical protein
MNRRLFLAFTGGAIAAGFSAAPSWVAFTPNVQISFSSAVGHYRKIGTALIFTVVVRVA